MDIGARGLAIAASKANTRQALRDKLLRALAWGRSNYTYPEALPVLFTTPVQRADATSYAMGSLVAVGSSVYIAAGSTGAFTSATTGTGTAPSGTGQAIQDGAVIWAYVGYLAPVAWATALTVYADQIVYNGGNVFRAGNAGTTAASGSGPTPTSLSDNGITWIYEGKQTLPLVTNNSAAGSGLTQQVAWNSSKASILGGTIIQNTTNARGGIVNRSGDGGAYTETNGDGGGSVYTVTDAPKLDYTFTGGSGLVAAWVDGQVVALIERISGSSQRYINFDFSNVSQPRKDRVFRFEQPFSVKFAGFNATSSDSFSSYTPHENIKAVIVGDSFVGGSGARSYPLLYAVRLGHRLGIENWRNSGIGGTGLATMNGGLVTYEDRFTQDVVNQSPDLVIIQMSGNDTNTSTAIAALNRLIARAKAEIPNAYLIILGVWNNRATLSSNTAGQGYLMNQAGAAAAAAAGVPFIDWSDLLTDGGYLGHASGTGNSYFLTGDGTHPTMMAGDGFRALRLTQPFRATIQALT